MIFCTSCAPEAKDGPVWQNFWLCLDCQNQNGRQHTKYHQRTLHGHPERNFLESLCWIPFAGAGQRGKSEEPPSWSWTCWDSPVDWRCSWAYGRDTFLTADLGSQANMVKFFYSSPEKNIRKVNEDIRPFSELRDDLQRQALRLLLKTAPTWWPSAAEAFTNLSYLSGERLNLLAVSVISNAQTRGWVHADPVSRSSNQNRSARFKELNEDACASLALESLMVNNNPSSWWPVKDSSPEIWAQQYEDDNGADRSNTPYETALRYPCSLLFNTTCAYLSAKPYDSQTLVIPRNRTFTRCHIMTPDGATMVGITTSMSPQFAINTFLDADSRGKKLYPVFVIGACTAKRIIEFSPFYVGPQTQIWDELCLQVMIAEEDLESGIMKRLALGVVYPDMWGFIDPEWKCIVLA